VALAVLDSASVPWWMAVTIVHHDGWQCEVAGWVAGSPPLPQGAGTIFAGSGSESVPWRSSLVTTSRSEDPSEEVCG
jgi:hypothetical protein